MKFSCPSCQAKYQLADEKVAGRTVKMKCRKCGTIVPVNADGVVTDALAADSAPLVSLMPAPPSVAPRAAAPRAAAPRPAAPKATASIGGSGAKGPPAGTTTTASVANGEASPAAARAGLAGAAPRTTAPSAVPTTSPLASARRASAGVAKPAVNVVVAEAPVPEFGSRADEVAGPPSMRRLASRAPVAIPEWFAGVDGAPLGPMTREELRAKVVENVVTADTLVWRDGMSGWVAMSAVPDVSDLLPARGVGAIPGAPAAPVGPTAPAAQPAVAITGVPASVVVETARDAPADAGSTTGLNFEKSTNAEAAFFSGAEPRPAPKIPRPPADHDHGPLSGDRASTATIQLPEPDVRGQPSPSGSSAPPRPSMWMRARHKSVSKTQIGVAVGGALAFGVAMGFVLFSGNVQTKVVKEIVEVRVPVAAPAAPPAPPTVEETTQVTTQASTSSGNKTVSPGSSVGSSATTGKASGDGGLRGLAGLGDAGVAGPTLGGGTGPNAGGNSQPLESSQIQSTVSKYQSAVKRGCWEPALSSRDKDAPSSARVTVSINVTAAGTVQSASGSGDPRGYRGLSSCIERRVLAWQFPRSNGSTTVKVPFVFAAQ